MQPIIRRTITITITETWTITWADGQETVWHETQAVSWPTDPEANEPWPRITSDTERGDEWLDPDGTAATEDE